MIKLIKNGELYGPEYLGKKDILITGDKIADIKNEIKIDYQNIDIRVIEAENKIVVPGFIDSHQHLIGGGGEGGFKTRTPEIQLSEITRGGITTVVGCLGTDGTTRNLNSLLAKARGLEEEGITTHIYSGSYQFPVKTITGKISDDIILIDKVIGIGELAISDHRSSQPALSDLKKAAAEARVGGMISGKAGIINIHVGDGKRQIDYLEEIISGGEIPPLQFLPTHMNRSRELLQRSVAYTESGGVVDLTTSGNSHYREDLRSSNSLKFLLDKGVPAENITFSSDAQGSLPDFDEQGNFNGLKIGKATSLFNEVRDAIKGLNINITEALSVITSNPADILQLHNKGRLKAGNDADVVLLDKGDLKIRTVIAGGKILVKDKRIISRGIFEQEVSN